jgi:hypothetical protein
MKREVETGPGGDGRSWNDAYTIALGLFALEVILLYLFTIRFS